MQYFIYIINQLRYLIKETIKRSVKNLILSSNFSKILLSSHINLNKSQEILNFCG